MRIAIVGSGISGLACAHILGPHHDVTLYEADNRLGGHANTVTVEDPSAGTINVDTGFIVHNNRNYPELQKLFADLNVQTQASEMTFSVDDEASGLCYSATSLSSLFAQRKNIVKPALWRMLADIARFYRSGQTRLSAAEPDPDYTIGHMLADGGYSDTFVNLHLIPMGSAVWSANPEQFTEFPADSLLRFLDNHGLLGWGDRPAWRTVVNGSRSYVDALAARFSGTIRLGHPVSSVSRTPDEVAVTSLDETTTFDRVILACHSDQSLNILRDQTAAERRLLSRVAYQKNEAVLHTDTSILPSAPRSWAAWNYRRPVTPSQAMGSTVTYDLTRLQRLPGSRRYLVSLNSAERLDPTKILSTFTYAHPVFTSEAVKAQNNLANINGTDRVFFAGAWQKYGFHEDGMRSAVDVCAQLGVSW